MQALQTDPVTVSAFGEFELDDEAFELRQGGQTVRIEPRVLEVLFYLARNSGRVVTKQELIDNVWDRKFVTESALTRCIMAARKAIASSDAIRTIHGRGYRFVAPLEARPAAKVQSLPIAALPEPECDTAASEQESAVDEGAPAPGSLAGEPQSQTRIAPAFRLAEWRILPAVITVLALLVATVTALLARRTPTPPEVSPAATSRTIRIALLPISVSEESSDLNLLAISISDLLSHRLAESSAIRLQPPEYGKVLSEQTSSLAEFARRAGVSYVISGTLERSSDGTRGRFIPTLHEVRSPTDVRNTPLGVYDLPWLAAGGDVSLFVRTRDSIIRHLVRELMPAIDGPRPAGVAPASPEAYRLYLLAKRQIREKSCDADVPLELLGRSLALDPAFAPAWELYAATHYGLASTCLRGTGHYDEALRAVKKALSLDRRSVTATALHAIVLSETGRPAEAHESLTAFARARAPEVDDALSVAMLHGGSLARAREHALKAIAHDPSYYSIAGRLPLALLYSGDLERFLDAVPAADAPNVLFHRGLAAALRQRDADARRALEPAFRINPGDAYGRLSQALLAILDGRKNDAAAMLRRVGVDLEQSGSRNGELHYLLARLHRLSGDREAAASEAGRAVRDGFIGDIASNRTWIDTGAGRDVAYAKQAAAEFDRRIASAVRR